MRINTFSGENDVLDSSEENISGNPNNETKAQYAKSPFYKRSLEILIKVKDEINIKSEDCNENNYKNDKFLNIILTKWMPYVVFWSNIMGKFVDNNETRISNSPVEGYFSIMKNKTLRGKKNVRPTEYIRSTHGYIHAKINEVECKHLCTPCKEKKVKNTELVEEVWDRTPKKLKENLNKKMVLGERCFKTDDIILSGKFPKNLKNIKILYAKYGHIFEYVDESVKSFRTTSILFNEMESLNHRKEIFNHILEIYIHILVFENKMKNVAICTCEEGEAIFFMKDTSLDLKNIFEIEKKHFYYTNFTLASFHTIFCKF